MNGIAAPRATHILCDAIMTILVAGCAARVVVPAETTGHPANPRAAAAPAPAAARALTPDVFDGLASPLVSTPEQAPSHAEAGHDTQAAPPATISPARTTYACSMHPEVREPRPGKCPKCGMVLSAMAGNE